MYIKPTKGCKVMDPTSGRPIPEEGQNVPRTSYWLRRIKEGVAEEAKAPTPKTEASK